jgi:SAM-dependent methyltransferase
MSEVVVNYSRIDNGVFESVFSCPQCKKGSLSFSVKSSSNNANHKKLLCNKCDATFPIIDNIPRLVELENYGESFGYQWNIYRKTQLDSHSGLPISRNRVKAATGWSGESLKGQRILEAGSGAGRFTEILVETEAELFSFDYSSAVEANAKNNGESNNLTLFQGDIFNIPFNDKSFDHVFCLGVIQHTPDPETAFFSLANKVKGGGFLYIDVYTQSWYHYLHWKYILRPITMRINRETLFRALNIVVPLLIPVAKLLRKLFGRAGARLVPIVEFSYLGLKPELNKEWAILDTFDMYSPAHDHPQSMKTVKRWFSQAGFSDVSVWYGANGVVGRGKKT